jgi:hypothetical protein
MPRQLLIGLGCGLMSGILLAFAAQPRIATAQATPPLSNSNRDWSATAGHVRDLAPQHRHGRAGILHLLQRGPVRCKPHQLPGNFRSKIAGWRFSRRLIRLCY